jgi:DNA polymerase-3 subunit epsilon
MILFTDTETSGLPLFNEPSDDPRQPHIVQLAARLVDLDTREIISTIDLVIRPDGWEIPDEVAQVHGLTTERAAVVGVDERLALDMLLDLHGRSQFWVAHNAPFDQRIVRIACKRFHGDERADAWKDAPFVCTQSLATQIMKLPPTERMIAAKRFHYKSPNLREAFKFFTGRELEGAHSALADVDAAMAVFFAIFDDPGQALPLQVAEPAPEAA